MPLVRRLLRLSAEERRIVAEAVALAPVAAVVVRAFGLERAAGLLARGRQLVPSRLEPERIAALVNASITHVGGRCLVKALVLHGMLARRGLASTIVVGTATVDGFRAHAWVSMGPSTPLRTGQLYAAIWRFPRTAA